VKIAIIGSRSFQDYDLVQAVLSEYSPTQIISGGAKGADSLAERFAAENNIEKLIFYPDWDLHGRAAGPIRNKLIVDAADFVLAFWDGASRGTKSSIDYANKIGKSLRMIKM